LKLFIANAFLLIWSPYPYHGEKKTRNKIRVLSLNN
jgi:hypothetical protein